MPRENRKRGKKHKRQPEQPEHQVKFEHEEELEEEPEPIAFEKPSWIVSGPKREGETDPGAPYGYVDVDVKAYFRTVDLQIRDWQDKQDEGAEETEDIDPNERMLHFLNHTSFFFDISIYYRKTFVLHCCTG